MNLPAPRTGFCLGVDTSAAQGRLDVAALGGAGVAFVIAKATDGTSVDGQWLDTVAGCALEGMPLGAYHVLEVHADPLAQADAFIEAVRGVDLVCVVLDFELGAGETAAQALRHAVAWRDRVRDALGRPVLVYAAESFVDGLALMSGPPGHADVMALATSPLWVAWYGDGRDALDPTAHAPRLPHAWATWSIWQVGPSGTKGGPWGRDGIDVDWFRGTLDELLALGRPTVASAAQIAP